MVIFDSYFMPLNQEKQGLVYEFSFDLVFLRNFDQGHMSISSISQTGNDAPSVKTCECIISMKRENDLETITFNDSEPKPW